MRFDARSFLSISPARWILAATKSPIDQDTASVFMEMRSWPQPVKDRESVLLRRAVSRHTPHDGWPDRCTCFGKRIWSDHLTLLPILSVSLTPPVPPIPPRFELDSNSIQTRGVARSRNAAESKKLSFQLDEPPIVSFPPPRLQSNSLSRMKNV